MASELAAAVLLLASLAGPAVTPAELELRRAQEPARAAAAVAHLGGQRVALRLGARDELRPGHAFTNEQGNAIVRVEHTYGGHRVLGSQAVVEVRPDGTSRTLAQRLRGGIALAAEPRLDAAQATRLALAHLARLGPTSGTTAVERVVFPAELAGGLPTAPDPVTGRPTVDRFRFTHARPTGPFAWAYRVSTGLRVTPDGPHELTYLVDGDTGNLLRIDDLLQHATAPQPKPIPMIGAGLGFYRGQVSLPTSRLADGTYALYDPTRGTLPNPLLQQFTPDGSGWSARGLQVWYEEHDRYGSPTGYNFLFQANPIDRWGDGASFDAWGLESGPNGQSVGVDALSAVVTTWDFFGRVFGRLGVDGRGTTPAVFALQAGPFGLDNAWWSVGSLAAYLGAGSYPSNPGGLCSLTDLDIVAHELAHGLSSPTTSQYLVNGEGFEESGLNEATCDYFGALVASYAARPPGAPDNAIPATGMVWQIGAGINHGTPLRWLDRPSRDGHGIDAWYDGVKYLDGHLSAGPITRALYFLARGAVKDPAADGFSPYLPDGMLGVGNDTAARIWFKAVTERLIGDGTGALTFQDARAAALASAQDLYGAGSAPAVAVENAFGAVNVGVGHGQPARTQVRFADWRQGDYIDRGHTDGLWSERQAFPKGETVMPRVSVTGTADTSVDWSVGGPSMFNGAPYFVSQGGRIEPDGSWSTPNQIGWFSITATSRADPLQFAEGRTFLINMDTDADGEQDAMDLGGIAFSWYLTNGLTYNHSVFQAPWVDDGDVSLFVDAMRSAWPAK